MCPHFPRSHGRSYLGAGGDISGVRRLQGAAGAGAGEEEESWALTQRPSGGHPDMDTVAPRHTGDVAAETIQGDGEKRDR